MELFNKGLRTVQFDNGEINPQEVITVDNKFGSSLCDLFPNEIVDLAKSKKELTKGSKKGKSPKEKQEASQQASE